MQQLGARYDACFKRLGPNEGVFVPFLMLGDPDPDTSRRLLRAVLDAGADSLELGLPFSDPIADGSVVQEAALRARRAGTSIEAALDLVRELRDSAPDVPLGLLTYANLVAHRGPQDFYARAAKAGLDSVLVADLPSMEAAPFVAAAAEQGIASIMLAPTNLSRRAAERVARLGSGYTYCVTRRGVTGARSELSLDHGALFAMLSELGAPPPLLGFGIAKPEHVRAALASGASGAICGSALIRLIEPYLDEPAQAARAAATFVQQMKDATRPHDH
ncbi:MAG: tryptophan synthase subunit alpha [Proteobacteria bacterium]|nr:tryptophan synthase subunit alpha [Pseudomonadota bacterium]